MWNKRASELEREGAAQPATTYHQHPGLAQRLLMLEIKVRQNQLTTELLEFAVTQHALLPVRVPSV